jgi:hypothetical protein
VDRPRAGSHYRAAAVRARVEHEATVSQRVLGWNEGIVLVCSGRGPRHIDAVLIYLLHGQMGHDSSRRAQPCQRRSCGAIDPLSQGRTNSGGLPLTV